METNNAERDEGRALLPTGEGEGSQQGKRGGDLPEVNRVVVSNREETKVVAIKKDVAAILPRAIKDALKECEWNIAAAAKQLGLPLRTLSDIIRGSKEIREWVAKVKAAVPVSEWDEKLLENLEKDIHRRALIYKSEALEAIAELALMPISQNPQQNQVKLLAASKLYADTGMVQAGSEIDATLKALNEQYQSTAPKIREIRERTIVLENNEKVISG